MSQFVWNTSPPAIQAQVERYVADVRAMLGGALVGVYLHGSLAMGCFNPAQSDLDVLVVTRAPMSLAMKRDIADHLLRASRQPAPIEVSFLALAMLTPWRHPLRFDLHYSEMWRDAYMRDLAGEGWRSWNARDQRDPDLSAHITVVRQRGIALYGPPAASVFPEVPETDYIAAIMSDVTEALDRIYADPVYAILNVCRTLAFLQMRRVLSKEEGGQWALDHLPPALRPLVQTALMHYCGAEDRGMFPAVFLEAFCDYARQALGQGAHRGAPLR
jgi:streptomycin 3"-adenylyltransferase